MDTSSFPLSTDFLRDLGIIAQDESRMRRAIRYIKRLAAEKPDPTLMSKEEFSAKLERSEEQYRQGKYKAFTNIEDLDQYIRSLWFSPSVTRHAASLHVRVMFFEWRQPEQHSTTYNGRWPFLREIEHIIAVNLPLIDH